MSERFRPQLVLDLSTIGRRLQCPRCGQLGVMDDVNTGRVIVRHDAEVWHVMSDWEAAAINWARTLR